MKKQVVDVGIRKVIVLEDFLPEPIQGAFFSYAIERRPRFTPSLRTLNDSEYRCASTLADVGPYSAIFETALAAAWREILLSLAMELFTPVRFDLRLTLLRSGAYRKPRSDALHGESGARLSLIYVLGRQPKPYEGGDLRFFEHNPYEHRAIKFKRKLEFPTVPNSLTIFPSSIFYALDEIMESAPGFSNECLLLDGVVL